MRADENSSIEHANLHHETGIHIAEEWGAAVVGCMMQSRLEQGQEHAQQIAERILREISSESRPTLVGTIVMASCQNPAAEPETIKLAISTLETAFHNSDIEECGETLRQQNRGWRAMFSE
jgi:hypothetical protein